VNITAEDVSIDQCKTVCSECASRYLCMLGVFQVRYVLIHVIQYVSKNVDEIG